MTKHIDLTENEWKVIQREMSKEKKLKDLQKDWRKDNTKIIQGKMKKGIIQV